MNKLLDQLHDWFLQKDPPDTPGPLNMNDSHLAWSITGGDLFLYAKGESAGPFKIEAEYYKGTRVPSHIVLDVDKVHRECLEKLHIVPQPLQKTYFSYYSIVLIVSRYASSKEKTKTVMDEDGGSLSIRVDYTDVEDIPRRKALYGTAGDVVNFHRITGILYINDEPFEFTLDVDDQWVRTSYEGFPRYETLSNHCRHSLKVFLPKTAVQTRPPED